MWKDSFGLSSKRKRSSSIVTTSPPLYTKSKLNHHAKMFINPGPKYGKIIHDFSYFNRMNEI